VPISLEPKPGAISVEKVESKRRKLGDNCDLSNQYVDVAPANTCPTQPGGRDHQMPGFQRDVSCSKCGTTFSVRRNLTTGGFNTASCPTCGNTVGYMGMEGTCQWYSCSGSSCSSNSKCPTKRVIDECDLEIINDLICQMRAELKDGNTTCFAFSAAELSAFLDASLSRFNGTPHFTSFTWRNIDLTKFRYIIVEGAVLLAMSAQVLIEAGREFTINDNGISFTPAQVSQALSGQFSARYTQYNQDLDFIKLHFKPGPVAILNYQSLLVGSGDAAGGNPAISKLRHLRGRRVF
jgi:hypothetical protein